jgi:hypothetical protein
MKIENDKLRPLLTKRAGQFEEVWCSYEGAAPVWMFQFLNTHTRGYVKVIGFDILECYQTYFERNKMETHYEESLHVTPQKGETFACAQRKSVRTSIRNFFRDFLKLRRRRDEQTQSLDSVPGEIPVRDEIPDEVGKDFSIRIRAILGKLDRDSQDILLSSTEWGGKKAGAFEKGLAYETFRRRFEDARLAFVARCGLEVFRPVLKGEMQKILDVLVESGGDIARAAEIFGVARGECCNRFRRLLREVRAVCGNEFKILPCIDAADLPREEALHSHFMKSECGGIGSGASVGGGEAHSHFMKSECGGIGSGASVGGGEAHSHFMKSECGGIGSGASVGGGEAHSHFMKSECGNISNCKPISRKGQLRNGGMRNGGMRKGQLRNGGMRNGED